jgi:hypothetical protein
VTFLLINNMIIANNFFTACAANGAVEVSSPLSAHN